MTTTTVSTATSLRAGAGKFLAANGPLVGLVALCLVLFIATPVFLTGQNLLNVGIQASTIAVLAFGMTFVIVASGIDLSVGSVAALSAMGSAWVFAEAGMPGWIAIIAGLALGGLLGAVSGLGPDSCHPARGRSAVRR